MEPNPMEAQMLDAIDAIRAEHHACTAGALALHLRMKKPTIVNRMERLRIKGFVTWTAMPGSLRVVAGHAADAAEAAVVPGDPAGSVVVLGAVAESAGPVAAPVADDGQLAGQTNIIDHLADELGTNEGVAVDGDNGPTIHVGPPVRNEAKVAKKAPVKKAAKRPPAPSPSRAAKSTARGA